jgi:hypothetical protein
MKLSSPYTILTEIGRAGYLEKARITDAAFAKLEERKLLQCWGGHVLLTRRGLDALHNRRRYRRGGKR